MKKKGPVVKALAAAAATIFLLAGTSKAANWQIETVDSSGPARSTSLKVDKEGNVHVCYMVEDANQHPLKYAFWDHSLKSWFTMVVDLNANGCSLTLDSTQRPHISYMDYGTADGARLRYAHWDGKAWTKQAIPLNSQIVGFYSSIALDANDNPIISFYEYRGPRGSEIVDRLRAVKWNGNYWQVQTVDGDPQSGKFNCIATDSQGYPHIAYANVSAALAGMRYAYWDGESWKREVVEGLQESKGTLVGSSACLVLDKEGAPHLSYINTSLLQVKYAVRKDGHWQIQIVDEISGAGYPDRNSIAVDDQGRPYIGYFDAGQGILKVAHQEGQKWEIEIVDQNSSGFTSSMQIDRGLLWISYSDDGNGGLKVARRELGARDAPSISEAPEQSSSHVGEVASK